MTAKTPELIATNALRPDPIPTSDPIISGTRATLKAAHAIRCEGGPFRFKRQRLLTLDTSADLDLKLTHHPLKAKA
jgi:hypothetical protein